MSVELDAFKNVAKKLGVSPRKLFESMKMAGGADPRDFSSGDPELERFLLKLDKAKSVG